MSHSFKFVLDKKTNNVIWLLYGGAAVITGYFNSQMKDPFNTPKFLILILISCWLAGHLIANYKQILKTPNVRKFAIIITIFISLFLFSAVVSNEKFSAFFGIFQRKNGFLSYLALGIIAISASLFTRFSNLRRLYLIVLFLSGMLITYGFLQANGKDFVQWNNPYNSIISTVGNPNFAAAVMAILATISFSAVFINDFHIVLRAVWAVACISLIYLIYLSNSRQGLLAFGLAAGIFVSYLLYTKNKIYGRIASSCMVAITFLAILGMLQMGPLANLLYKPSVSVRGYYWRAALKMLQDNPIFGVGIESYVSNFRYYREVGYPLNYGFTISSSNAHNVPLQFFSTGGIFLGIAYLMLIGFVFITSVKTLRRLEGSIQIVYLGIFTSWIAYLAQSFISIDNIGIAIWGWLLSGILIGLASNYQSDIQIKVNKSKLTKEIYNFKQISWSVLLIIPALVVSSYMYSSERNMWKQPMVLDQNKVANNPEFYKLAKQTIENPFADPQFILESSINLYLNGYKDEGKELLKKLANTYPRNFDVLQVNAGLYEQERDFIAAIAFRERIAEIDPYNALNFLILGQDYKNMGDMENKKLVLEKILSFAPNTPEAERAKLDLA